MFAVLIAIVLLIASVSAIYLLLKSMGQDGVEIAAPGSCKSGRCGVRKDTASEPGQEAEATLAENADTEAPPVPDRQLAEVAHSRERSG